MASSRTSAIDRRVRRAIEVVERSREPRRLSVRFLATGLGLSLMLAGGVVALAERYSIAIAGQASLCLPPYRIWLIDKHDTTPTRGDIFAFKSQGLSPVFNDGTLIVKVLEGMPGDMAKVNAEGSFINDHLVGEGMAVATNLGLDPARYYRSGTIEEGRYWFFGKTNDSFDSRYWGAVDQSQITGKAYPLW